MVEPRISGTSGMRQEYTLTGEWDASPLQSTRNILITTDNRKETGEPRGYPCRNWEYMQNVVDVKCCSLVNKDYCLKVCEFES